MKKINAIVAGLIIFSATGCGNPEKTVSVRDVNIEGSIACNEIQEEIDEYVTVDDGSYTFWIEDDLLLVNVPFKKTNSLPDNIDIAKINDAHLTPLDKSGNEIATQDGILANMEIVNVDDLRGLILYTWVGNSYRLTFKFALLGEKEILDKINSFEINMDIDFKEKEIEKESSSTITDTPSPKTGGVSYSEFLDEYEDYVKQLKSILKKATKGDLSAITEYASLLEKAESLSEKLEDMEDDMTMADLDRLDDLEDALLDLIDVDLDLSSSLEDALSFF